MPKNLRFKCGQSVIEVVIGISVVVILAISLITTVLISQRTARSAQNNTIATKLAQQTIEQMRVLRDRRGFSLLTPIDGTCLILSTNPSDPNDPAQWQLGTCPEGEPETVIVNNVNFSRKITNCYDGAICATETKKKLVTVTVSWQEPGGNQSVTNETFFTDWCPANIIPPTPCP